MSGNLSLIQQLDRRQFLGAIKLINNNTPSIDLEKKSDLEVVYLESRYPLKLVVELALKNLARDNFSTIVIKKSELPSAKKILRQCGFTVVRRKRTLSASLKNDLMRVLKLQAEYSSSNTVEMKERGELIRFEIPAHLENNVEKFESIFSNYAFSCVIEGSDGVGRKNESAWVRIFDPLMSPSATTGWYLVLHFSRKGDVVFAAISCGATYFKDGSLVNLASSELQRNVLWARIEAEKTSFNIEHFSDDIQLYGNKLSKQFEKAVAFARAYNYGAFNENEFWSDLNELSTLLVTLYELERQGKNIGAISPDINIAESEIASAIKLSKKSLTGQGRGLSHPERIAVELRAMAVTRSELVARGFTQISDVSDNKSYDFYAIKDQTEWFVEVKGTTSKNANIFLLTAQELKFHHQKKGSTILALVSNVTLHRNGETPIAEGGELELIVPWNPETWIFEATAFRAERKVIDI